MLCFMNVEAGSFHIAELTPEHADAAARLHIAGQPGTFLTSLGSDVLTLIYRVLPTTPTGFGVVILDASTTPHRVAGFASATTSTGTLFANVVLQSAVDLFPALARAAIRNPALIGRMATTAAYPFQMTDSDGFHTGELLSIMVEPERRSAGLGAALLAALTVQCQRRGIQMLDVTVDAANEGARRFYVRNGFVLNRQFILYGRPMCQFAGKVPTEETVSAGFSVIETTTSPRELTNAMVQGSPPA